MARNWLWKKHYNIKSNWDFWLKMGWDKFKSGVHIVLKFRNCILRTDSEITHQRACVSDQAGPGRFITVLDYMVKKKHFFCFLSNTEKSMGSEISHCFDFPYEWKEAAEQNWEKSSIARYVWKTRIFCVFLLSIIRVRFYKTFRSKVGKTAYFDRKQESASACRLNRQKWSNLCKHC